MVEIPTNIVRCYKARTLHDEWKKLAEFTRRKVPHIYDSFALYGYHKFMKMGLTIPGLYLKHFILYKELMGAKMYVPGNIVKLRFHICGMSRLENCKCLFSNLLLFLFLLVHYFYSLRAIRFFSAVFFSS